MNIEDLLKKYGIKPDPIKDQFFLNDKKIIKKMVGLADLSSKDVVLEVGAGIGNVTCEIAQKAGRVIAFEIDRRFQPFLKKLPANVQVYYQDAWDFVQLERKEKSKKEYNKVVSNLPYSFAEPFFHNLTFLEYDKVILLVPKKFLKTIAVNPVFSSFFKVELKIDVPKDKFYPAPKTNSVVIDLVKLPDPVKNKNAGLFLRQYLYCHEKQLVKNSLREGIIEYARLALDKKITKNQARKITSDSGIPKDLLEKTPNNAEIYQKAGKISFFESFASPRRGTLFPN